MTPFRLTIWRGVNRILHKKIIALYADDGRNPAKIISTGQCPEMVSRNVFEEADNGFGSQAQMRIVRYGGYGSSVDSLLKAFLALDADGRSEQERELDAYASDAES